MARTDAIVLGAGIVGTSVALHLAKRGLSVALVNRRGRARNELRQHRRDRRRERVPDRVPAQPEEAHPSGAEARAGGELPLGATS